MKDENPVLQEGVAAVRDQVESIAARQGRAGTSAGRVRVRRVFKPTPYWRITARIEGSDDAKNLSFTPHEVEIGSDLIVLSREDQLRIVGAGLKDDTLTLCIAETAPDVEATDRKVERTGDLLRETTRALAQMHEPARRIAAARAFRAVSKAIANSPIHVLTEAASASTDAEVLIRALQQPDAIETLQADDPLGPARLRGLREREQLLAVEGGTLSADDVARHLNITRQAVNKRRQQGALVGLDAGRHGYLYPAWQFVRAGTIAGLEAALAALKEHDPWMQHIFMVSRNARLDDRTPLEELRRGQIAGVVQAAQAYGEHGAA